MSTPLKVLYLARRNPELSEEAFTTRWRQHAANGMSKSRWSNVQRYAHWDLVRDSGFPGATDEFDGIGELIFFSVEHRATHVADLAAQSSQENDELETFSALLRHSRLEALTTTVGAPDAPARVFEFVWRAPDVSAEDFAHASLVPDESEMALRGIRSITVDRSVSQTGPGASGLGADVVHEYGYADVESLLRDGAAFRPAEVSPVVGRTVVVVATETVHYLV